MYRRRGCEGRSARAEGGAAAWAEEGAPPCVLLPSPELTRFSTRRLAPSQPPAGPTKPLCAGRAGGHPAGLTPTRAAAVRGSAGTRTVCCGGVGSPHRARGRGHARVNDAGARVASLGQSASAGATAANGKAGGPTPRAYPLGRGNGRGPDWVPVWIHKAPDAPFPGLLRKKQAQKGVGSRSQEVARSRFEPRSAWLHKSAFPPKWGDGGSQSQAPKRSGNRQGTGCGRRRRRGRLGSSRLRCSRCRRW